MGKKRVYEVVNNNPSKKSLKLGKETFRYGKNGVFTVKDPEIGKEIAKEYGDMDAVVNEVELSTNTEAGHTYTFSGVDLPWKRPKIKDDPNWEEYAPGKWRRVSKKRMADEESEEEYGKNIIKSST